MFICNDIFIAIIFKAWPQLICTESLQIIGQKKARIETITYPKKHYLVFMLHNAVNNDYGKMKSLLNSDYDTLSWHKALDKLSKRVPSFMVKIHTLNKLKLLNYKLQHFLSQHSL